MLLILLIIIKQTSQIANPICQGKRYLCAQAPLQKNVCVSISDPQLKIHYLSKCPDNQFCDYQKSYQSLQNMTFYCINNPPVTTILPGQSCILSSECISNNCSQGICMGLHRNENCTSNSNCSIGLFCNMTTLKCIDQVLFLQYCDNDTDCINSCVCNFNKCNYYYSLTINTNSNNPKACESGYIYNSKCALPPKSIVPYMPCTSDLDCIVTFQDKNVTNLSFCQCGYNGGGFSYCSQVQGDQSYQNMIMQFGYLLINNEKCHTNIRQGPCKSLLQGEYQLYKKFELEYVEGTNLLFNDECTKDTLNKDYWNSKEMIAKIISLLILWIMLI